MESRSSANGRETRLLLVTIAVSVSVLILLARFRFPEQEREAPAAAAPLELLAARAAYDELASTITTLERRVGTNVAAVPVTGADGSRTSAVAVRVSPERMVVLLRTLEGIAGGDRLVRRDYARGLAVVRAEPSEADAVSMRTGAPRPGPRYVAIAEATGAGVVFRPAYVARIALAQDGHTGTPLVTLAGMQPAPAPGAAVFSLEGAFLGLAAIAGDTTRVITAEFLKEAAGSEAAAAPPPGSLGTSVQDLDDPLRRALGAASGIAVSAVQTGGPADGLLQPMDVIQAVDGTAVTSVATFAVLEITRAPGSDVVLDVSRDGATRRVTLRAANALAPPALGPDDHGLDVRAMPGGPLEVAGVAAGSAAARAGLRTGDVIVSVAGGTTLNEGGLARVYRSLPSGGAIVLAVRRDGRPLLVPLEKQ